MTTDQWKLWALLARRRGGSPLLASPRPKLPGGGTEVAGHRDYASGDCFQHVDWTRCARRDELLVKVFEGESDRHVHILLDCSPSMTLGRPASNSNGGQVANLPAQRQVGNLPHKDGKPTGDKFGLARQIAAALGYVSLLDGDRLSMAAFADGLKAALLPLRHESRSRRLFDFLEKLTPAGAATDLNLTTEAIVRRPLRPGPIVVISDLYDPAGFHAAFDRLRYFGYLPRLVEIVDPRDADPRLLGDVEILDIESQTTLRGTVTERVRRRYRALVAEFRESVRDYCRRHCMPAMRFMCDEPADRVLQQVIGAASYSWSAHEPPPTPGRSPGALVASTARPSLMSNP